MNSTTGSNVVVDASSTDESLSSLLSDSASLLREIGRDEVFALVVEFGFCLVFELEVVACDGFAFNAFDGTGGNADQIIC